MWQPKNYLVSVFVPSTFGENSPADVELVNEVLTEVQKRFCVAFGGCTTNAGFGQWVNDDNEVISEPVNIVSAYSDCTFDVVQQVAIVVARHVQWQLNQTCVLWSVVPAQYALEYA